MFFTHTKTRSAETGQIKHRIRLLNAESIERLKDEENIFWYNFAVIGGDTTERYTVIGYRYK